jgi:hypothetical protein
MSVERVPLPERIEKSLVYDATVGRVGTGRDDPNTVCIEFCDPENGAPQCVFAIKRAIAADLHKALTNVLRDNTATT